MNCDHSEEGWCLECVKKLYYEKEAAEARQAPEPKYQHTEAELRYVADILAALNRVPEAGSNVGVEGEVEVFWCDRVMGVIGLDDSDNLQSWVYFPSANVNYESR